jgi:SAM-dependent methyltransferase
MDRQSHWNRVYETKAPDTVSWYERYPNRSLAYIQKYATVTQRVMDVGAGASPLAGALLDLGYADPVALDVSAAGLERAEARLGERATHVTWIVADITRAPDLPPVDLWHDRAVLHFLTDEADQKAYAQLAARTVTRDGHLVVATFAPDGPERCSGLLVHRYDGSSLAKLFESAFELLEEAREVHVTPTGAEQRFTWTVFRRRSSELRRPRRSSFPDALTSPSEHPTQPSAVGAGPCGTPVDSRTNGSVFPGRPTAFVG